MLSGKEFKQSKMSFLGLLASKNGEDTMLLHNVDNGLPVNVA